LRGRAPRLDALAGSTRLFEGVRIEGQAAVVSYDDLSIDARQTILNCAEDLLEGQWPVAKSERLRAAVEKLRAEIARHSE
jgi:hypothetical protein